MLINIYALGTQAAIRDAFVCFVMERRRTDDFPSREFEGNLEAALRSAAICYSQDTSSYQMAKPRADRPAAMADLCEVKPKAQPFALQENRPFYQSGRRT